MSRLNGSKPPYIPTIAEIEDKLLSITSVIQRFTQNPTDDANERIAQLRQQYNAIAEYYAKRAGRSPYTDTTSITIPCDPCPLIDYLDRKLPPCVTTAQPQGADETHPKQIDHDILTHFTPA